MPDHPGGDDILLQGLANLLQSQANLRVAPAVSGQVARHAVGSAVARVGNWVGGRFFLFSDRLVFQTNSMNRRFQADGGGVVVELAQVQSLATGRLMRVFKTLDITTEDRVFRLRLGRRNRLALEAALRRLCPKLQAG